MEQFLKGFTFFMGASAVEIRLASIHPIFISERMRIIGVKCGKTDKGLAVLAAGDTHIPKQLREENGTVARSLRKNKCGKSGPAIRSGMESDLRRSSEFPKE